MVLIAQDEDNLQRLAHKFNAVPKKFNDYLGKKIKSIVIIKESISRKLEIVSVSKE